MRLLAAFLLLCGCPSAPAETPDPIDPGCSWALSAHCGLPWPDSRWLVDDPSTATGRRLVYEPTVLPANIDGVAFDPSEWERLDGFSPAAHALTAFPRPVDLDGLATIDGYDRSLEADSPTVLIDLETGEHIPHFVENDVRWFDGTDEGRTDIPVIFYLRPAIRLREDGWYGVALRGITLEDGSAAPVEPVFAALRDAVATRRCSRRWSRPGCPGAIWSRPGTGTPPRGTRCAAISWRCATTPCCG
jgi:hypothetical protein